LRYIDDYCRGFQEGAKERKWIKQINK
jgi:hypothetical protein